MHPENGGTTPHPRTMGHQSQRSLSASTSKTLRLFDLDGTAGGFDLLLDFLCFLFGNILLEGLIAGFNEIFRFFKAEAGDCTDFLNNSDFLSAGTLPLRTTVNSVCSSTGAAAAPAAGAAATATGAAAVTPNFSSIAFTRSEISSTVIEQLHR